MSDKNPKHPLKKKKVAAKVNMADHEAVEEAREAHKVEKACLLSDTPADDRRKGTGSCTARSACAPPVPFSCNRKLRSYYTKTCPKITHSLIQLHGVEFFCQQSQETLAEAAEFVIPAGDPAKLNPLMRVQIHDGVIFFQQVFPGHAGTDGVSV